MPRLPFGTGDVFRDDDRAHGKRNVSDIRAQRCWLDGPRTAGVVANAKWSCERMHESIVIENGVFVGIVRGTGADELRDEGALAGVRSSRDQNRAPTPADHAGMNEEARPRADSNLEVKPALERY